MDTILSKKAHAVVTPNSVEEEHINEYKYLQSNHRSIPSHVKTLACTWIYKRSHDFCKYTPVEEIPKMLCKFEVECTKDGCEINGNDTPVYKSMEFQSNCCVHWRCELCSLPMCIDPRAYIEEELVTSEVPLVYSEDYRKALLIDHSSPFEVPLVYSQAYCNAWLSNSKRVSCSNGWN